ncbi:DUF885 domain-containing protein [Streptomyces acidiscabies]|uniref:DUF885 domain-containing protein n=2 Tax=Streptomyces acidiscabies TaxID=42234 RepID=A0AAP6BG53_9ACTN|nr:DUF885 domain-containing protein [Streptomyces acidiscabies]MBP5941044.1 DUF885 domain-containing protein [Streptomyces sp. LBUM 1476]MBZ3912360.1 DUF885 domain-containing protein [Streptomyces acidiscabies]MDX2964136.1 DUF885 domain-containing protein [Streptomyces acidiscabies]MDX3021679.1 DUF885 domain-containing protein [Streptomyces acidiscabies]MDX3795052.1 DUF885 domain-containing protein [Streptomyces acidiscabies]
MSETNSPLPREVADAYVDGLIALDPVTGTYLGAKESSRLMPDLSPAGQEALADLSRRTLAALDEAELRPGADSDVERRCARLLRERLTAELAVHEAGEGLRSVGNLGTPAQHVREVFTVTPADTDEDWAAIAERLRAVPESLRGYRESLELGLERKLFAAPRPTATFVEQLGEWADTGEGKGWFEDFAASGPDALRAELDAAAREATAAVVQLRDWIREVYAPAIEDAPNVVGRERYARLSRYYNGTDLDLDEAYAYGWAEYHRLLGEMRKEAEKILPGAATPWTALAHLDEHGRHIEGVDEVRDWLQSVMDRAIESLDGTHFELAERVRKVESRIAPPGSAAAPYYTAPSEDFSRPGRTWLPTMGQSRFPVYDLVSTWYHEGVPGHHLQLAQWAHVAENLSRYQATVGIVSANAEGWALYAERLMDELGFLADAEERLGYLDAQMMRAVRVIIDIGMHLELEIPADSPFHPGERWTPELGQEFFLSHSSRPADFVVSELTRYLTIPGQAIGYKLGERAWLLGREKARERHGDAFDLKAWHMAALSQGSLGLDDLVDELAAL